MKPRKLLYGTKNISGANIERLRKEQNMKQTELIARMQTLGVDINPSSLSKLEGQQRIITDIELRAIAAIFHCKIDEIVSALEE